MSAARPEDVCCKNCVSWSETDTTNGLGACMPWWRQEKRPPKRLLQCKGYALTRATDWCARCTPRKLTPVQRKLLGSLARYFPQKMTIYGSGPHAAARALLRCGLVHRVHGIVQFWVATQAGVDLARVLGLLETKEPPTGVNTL